MILFVSDIHLCESRRAISSAFFAFLDQINASYGAATDSTSIPTSIAKEISGKLAQSGQIDITSGVKKLYILGDLFNFWAGDDIESPIAAEFREHARALVDRGVELYFQPGNRDFAIGKQFAKSCEMSIIPAFYRLPEAPDLMLLHGDELCTDDVEYQRYKRWIRNPITLFILRRTPRSYRLKLANKIRETSKNRADKAIIDVSQETVDRVFKHYGLTKMIHGHTHRPNTHRETFGTRYVLSDWDKTGDYLVRTDTGDISRIVVPIIGS